MTFLFPSVSPSAFHSRVYLNRSCLQFFLQLFRVLRSCQKQWKAWELWKRSWGTLSLSDGNWTWRSCTNHPGMCWESHSSIVKKPEVGILRFWKGAICWGQSLAGSAHTHVFFVSFEEEQILICWGTKFDCTAAHHATSQCPCVRSWRGPMPFSGQAASWWIAAVETAPAALTAATTASAFPPESQRNTMR